jgi:branched-chain amino acid transport system substrate-binding protein
MLRARKTLLMAVASAAAILMVASGCSSSKTKGSSTGTTAASSAGSTAGGSAGSGAGRTYTVGVLTDITGPASSTALTSPKGVQAGVGLAATEGYHIKYVVADTGSSPAGALAAAQKLVLQNHVYAVLSISSLAFAAAPFLASKGIPVIGIGEDGPEWLTSKNMFSVFGFQDFTHVFSNLGQYLKLAGGTVVGTVGIAISPASSEAAKGAAISAQAAGLKVGYVNANLPYGTTNVEPIVLAMKAAHVDAFNPAIDQTTSFAIIKTFRQVGVNLKVALLPTGYGGDLLQGGPATAQAAQGVSFQTSWEPIEMNTQATQSLVNALKTYAGVTSLPTFAEYSGYLSVDGFVAGLKKLAAGGVSNPSQSAYIDAMLGITDYNGSGLLPTGTPGLYDDKSISFAFSGRGTVFGASNCIWVTKFVGSSFQLIPGADPICGEVIPGKTVSGNA